MAERDHHITLAQAIAYTRAWQQEHPGERRAWMLPRGIIDEILKQPGCAGIRVYAGNVPGDQRLVWVGTDEQGNDMTSGVIGEKCEPCPPFCSSGSTELSSAE
jgi:ABC-type dipeptide/oligopeptide/nickel transport system permease subunit